MAARVLVDMAIPVTLLESGKDVQRGALIRVAGRNLYRRVPAMSQAQEGLIAIGDPETRLVYNYALGGLSNQWSGAVPRFSAEDFTAGEQIHEKFRWPIIYDELAPYYTLAERMMSITADPRDVPGLPAGYCDYPLRLPEDWQSVRNAAAKYGQGLTTMPLADGPPHLLLRRGNAFHSFSNLLAKLTNQPLFQLITRAHALRLEWDPRKNKVASVIYCDRLTMSHHRLSADAFVVACGPLNSPKLLFNSACRDHPNGLGNSNGVLGKYLHDHPRAWWVVKLDTPLTSPAAAAYLTRLPYAASDPLLASSWTIAPLGTMGKVKSRLGLKTKTFGVQVFGTMVPGEEYYVRPSQHHKDEFGAPALEVHIEFERSALDNVIKAREHLVQVMEDAGYRATIRKIDPQVVPGMATHYGGAVRMHTSAKYGVTDGFNRLHDAPNVLVVDASSFTTGAEKNPTLTVMALAARSADRLALDLRAM
jgi:choline dehydrogenase-like flavoprotein